MSLLYAIERSRFRDLPAEWACSCMLQILEQWSTNSCVAYCYYNPLAARFISESDAAVAFGGMDHCFPAGHPAGWDFTDIRRAFIVSAVDLAQLRVMLGGWGDAFDEDGEEEDGEEAPEGETVSDPRELTEAARLI